MRADSIELPQKSYTHLCVWKKISHIKGGFGLDHLVMSDAFFFYILTMPGDL